MWCAICDHELMEQIDGLFKCQFCEALFHKGTNECESSDSTPKTSSESSL